MLSTVLPVGSTYAAGAAVLMGRLPIRHPCHGRTSFRARSAGKRRERALNRNVEWNSITIAVEAEAGPIALGLCVLTATTRLFL